MKGCGIPSDTPHPPPGPRAQKRGKTARRIPAPVRPANPGKGCTPHNPGDGPPSTARGRTLVFASGGLGSDARSNAPSAPGLGRGHRCHARAWTSQNLLLTPSLTGKNNKHGRAKPGMWKKGK